MHNNRRIRITLGIGTAMIMLIPGIGFSANVTVGTDINSAYVWRGITFNDSFVAQPSIDIAAPHGIGLNVWGNFDLDEYDVDGEEVVDNGDFSEIDLTLSYALPLEIDGVELSVGIVEFLFPDANESTREVYVNAGVDLGAGFGMGGFFTYDFDEVDDFYANVSLTYGYEIDEALSLELSGLLGFAGEDFASGTDSGLHEYQIALSAAYAPNETTELGAFVAYTDAADDDVLDVTDVDVFGGLSVYYSF